MKPDREMGRCQKRHSHQDGQVEHENLAERLRLIDELERGGERTEGTEGGAN